MRGQLPIPFTCIVSMIVSRPSIVWVWLLGVVLWSLLILEAVQAYWLVAVVESSEVVASRRFLLLHYFNGSSVGGSRVGCSREVGRVAKRGFTVFIIIIIMRGNNHRSCWLLK